jgi:hypothetical protein
VNRRDFLFLRHSQGKRVLELSCERLFMRAVDAQTASSGSGDALPVPEVWEGEPPRVVEYPTVDELFQFVDTQLRDADVLRLVDTHWLASEDLKRRLGDVVATFRGRGGVVEVAPFKSEPSDRQSQN